MQKSTRKPLRNSPYQGRTSGDVLRTVDQLQDESRSRASELEKLKVALAAAHQDLLEANMQNNELSEELEWSMKELSELQKEKNDWRCRSWLDQATGRSTVLAAPEKAGDPSCHAEEDQLYSDPGSAARLQMNQPAEQPGSGHAEQQQCLQEQLHAALLENEQLRIRLEASTNQQPPAPQVEEQLRTLLWKEQQDTLQRMQEELPGLQLEVDQLQAALRMAMSERDKALSQHTAVLAVSSGLQDQLEAAREQLAEQETQMAKLQAQAQDVAGLKQLAADLQQRVASVMAHNAGKDQQISSLSRSVSEKESRVAQLEAAAQDAERAQQAMREREQKKDAMLKQLCSQVASLQAQVAEHRGVRERLQAAVALALQTEASEGALAHPDSLRLAGTGVRAQTGGSHLQNLQQQSSTGGSAAPLQDRVQELEVALGSLKVRSDGLKTYLDITPAHESDRLSQGTNSSSLENVDTDGRRRPVAGSTSKQISTHRSLANGHSPQRRQPSSPAKALTPGRKVAASSTRSLLKSAAESPVSKRLASSMEAELKGSPGTQYAGLGAGTQPFGGAAANHANQPGLGKSRASGQKLVLLQ
ncbi:hypothetical protein WJX72_012003 [[Myrmecia] bisecta]|uniref:Uncharacterized protein n=1 Tax=[Myrmecia] bisecta TaxID=41462 RepID=A0AAW1Q247_9CHLO